MSETDPRKLESYLERAEAYDGGLEPEVERLVDALQDWSHEARLQPRAGFVNEVAEQLRRYHEGNRIMPTWTSRILAGALGAVALVVFGFIVITLFSRGEDELPVVELETPIPTAATATVAEDIIATETAEPTATVITADTAAPPLSGWRWYEESGAPGIRFQLPQAWRVRPSRPARYQAPETGSIIEVQAFDYAGPDWLSWVQNESQPGYSLADGLVRENALVRGRPAFQLIEVGSGSYTMELYVRDEGRVVRFFFQSGTLPRSEEEMDILATMLETVQFAGGNEGETRLPDGWQDGSTLTVYTPEQLEFTGDLQTITGTVETWQMGPPPNEATVVDAGGARYLIDLQSHYIFEGHPIAYLAGLPVRFEVEPGRSIMVKGFPSGETPNGTPRIYPLVVETHGAEEQVILFYQPLLDLYSASPGALAEYPVSATVYVRGPWEQVALLFDSEQEESVTDGIGELGANTELLVRGTLAGTEPPRLNVSELYYLDGACATVTSDVQQCQYYHPLRTQPASSPTGNTDSSAQPEITLTLQDVSYTQDETTVSVQIEIAGDRAGNVIGASLARPTLVDEQGNQYEWRAGSGNGQAAPSGHLSQTSDSFQPGALGAEMLTLQTGLDLTAKATSTATLDLRGRQPGDRWSLDQTVEIFGLPVPIVEAALAADPGAPPGSLSLQLVAPCVSDAGVQLFYLELMAEGVERQYDGRGGNACGDGQESMVSTLIIEALPDGRGPGEMEIVILQLAGRLHLPGPWEVSWEVDE